MSSICGTIITPCVFKPESMPSIARGSLSGFGGACGALPFALPALEPDEEEGGPVLEVSACGEGRGEVRGECVEVCGRDRRIGSGFTQDLGA